MSELLAQFNAIAAADGGIDDSSLADESAPVVASTDAAADAAGDGEKAAADAVADDDKPKPEKPKGAKPEAFAALREKQRQFKAAADAREAQIAAKEAAVAAREAAAVASSPERVRHLLETGDFDGAAKAWGFESWNAMNDHAAKAFADPSFKRIRELETRQQQLEAERQAARQEAEQREQAQRQAQAESAYVAFIGSELKASEDAELRAFHDDPDFVNAVLVQSKNHLQQYREEPDPHEIAKGVLAYVKNHYASLQRRFGSQSTANQAEATTQAVDTPDRAGSKPPARQTNKHVTRKGAADSATAGALSDSEWKALAKREMSAALEQDLKAGVF